MSRGARLPKAGIALLEEVVALGVGDVPGSAILVRLARNPDPAVVSERFAHQSQFRLVVARLRDAGRVDLGETGVGHQRTLLVGPPGRGHIRAHRVGREVVHVGVTARSQHHSVSGVALDLTGDKVAHDHAFGDAVDQDHVEHLVAIEYLGVAAGDLVLQGAVGTEHQLLAGLAAGVESPLNEDAAEGAGRQRAAVLSVERHPLGDRLVDDVLRELGQPPDVGLTRAEVSALDRVGEQPANRVAFVGEILRRVDPALCGDAVGPAGRVLVAEALGPETLGGEACGAARSCQPGADHDDALAGAVARSDQCVLVEPGLPLLLDRPIGDLCVQPVHHEPPPATEIEAESSSAGGSPSAPVKKSIGTRAKPITITKVSALAPMRIPKLRSGLSKPRV